MVQDRKCSDGRASGVGQREEGVLSEWERQLLSAYFDAELPPEKMSSVLRGLSGANPRYQSELDSLRVLRSELRAWIDEEMGIWGASRERQSVWGEIEGELRKIQRSRAEAGESFLGRFGFLRGRRSFRFIVGLGVSVSVGVLAFTVAVGDRSTPELRAMRSRGGEALDRPEVQRVSVNEAITRGEVHSGIHDLPRFGPAALPALQLPESMATAYLHRILESQAKGMEVAVSGRDQIDGERMKKAGRVLVAREKEEGMARGPGESDALRSWTLRLPAWQAFGKDFVTGGLQANGTDIYWVQSPGPVDLFPPEKSNEPPVIWVRKSSG